MTAPFRHLSIGHDYHLQLFTHHFVLMYDGCAAQQVDYFPYGSDAPDSISREVEPKIITCRSCDVFRRNLKPFTISPDAATSLGTLSPLIFHDMSQICAKL